MLFLIAQESSLLQPLQGVTYTCEMDGVVSVQESELPASSAPSVASPRAPVEFDARQSMKAWRIEQPNLILDAEHGVSAMPAGYDPSMLTQAVEGTRKESKAHLAVGKQALCISASYPSSAPGNCCYHIYACKLFNLWELSLATAIN